MKKIILAALMLPLSALAQTYPSPTFNSLTLQNPLTAANGGTGATTSTGSGAAVLATSPTLVTPALGTPSSATLTNATGLPVSTGISGLGTGVAAGLANAVTGSGSPVLATSPTIASPTVTGAFNATGLVTVSDLATQAANTILGNGTSSTAHPTALAVPSCSTAGTALQWTSASGLTCGTGYLNNSTGIAQTSTGQIYQNNGARINRQNDRVFAGTATLNDGNSSQATGDWTFNQYSVSGTGAFAYLEHNGTMNVGSPNGQPTIVAASRTSDAGAAGDAAIGVSSIVVNDSTTGAGGSGWNYYATAVRGIGSTGPSTLGFESDVTNLAAAVPIYPNQMFNNGLTANLWIAAGGELPFQGGSYTFNNVSAAIGIFANAPGSPTPSTQYDKGIVFGAGGIASGTAIALPETYSMTWFNSANQVTNAIFSNATTATGSTSTIQKIEFSDFGTLFVDGAGSTQFRVNNGVSGAANYVMATAAASGSSPTIQAQGTDPNPSLVLSGQGTGGVSILGYKTGTNVSAGYVGEYICAQVTNGGSPTGCATNTSTPVSLTTNTPVNIASISLTAGDYDVWGSVGFLPAGTTTTQNLQGWISTASATNPIPPNFGAYFYQPLSYPAGVAPFMPVGTRQINVSSTTTVYLEVQAGFSVSTMTGYGFLAARRRD